MTKVKCITLSKQGSDHAFAGVNNQDFVCKLPNLKMVLDGCGTCVFSEVGTRLFAQLFMKEYLECINAIANCSKENVQEKEKNDDNNEISNMKTSKETINEINFINLVNNVFATLTNICQTDEFLINNLCFTILVSIETESEFVVFVCGDGYILVNNGDEIEIIKLDDGEYPKYYAYNYIRDKELLQEYKDGVKFSTYRFSKSEYINVGVATDGFRFYEKLNAIETNKLFAALKTGRKGQIGMLINRNTQFFKDDISICF